MYGGGGIKELIHMYGGGGTRELIRVCVGGGQGSNTCVCGGRTKYYLCVWEGDKELILVCEGSRI